MVIAFISSFWFHKLTLLCKIQVDEYDIRNEECKYFYDERSDSNFQQ